MDRPIRHLLQGTGPVAIALLLAVALLAAGSPAAAQQIIQRIGGRGRVIINGGQVLGANDAHANEDAIDNVFLPADRTVLQQMGRARKWLDQGHYSDAIECLDKILDSPDNYFYQPDKQAPTHRSLKAEAQRLLGQMPREGRELYELHSGGNAQKMLDEALAAGDATKLAATSGRYFHTRAGYEATFLLGLYDLDHGLPLAGADVATPARGPGPERSLRAGVDAGHGRRLAGSRDAGGGAAGLGRPKRAAAGAAADHRGPPRRLVR